MQTPETALVLYAHWKMAPYSSSRHLLTPRSGRRQFRRPHSSRVIFRITSANAGP
jgi:hypothetical protein